MDGTWLRRNLRFLLLDLLVTAAFTALFFLTAPKWGDGHLSAHRAVGPAGYALLGGIAAGMLVRRWAPVSVLAAQSLLVGTFLASGYSHGPYFLAVAVTEFTVGRTSDRRRAAAAATGATVAIATGELASYVSGHVDGGWNLTVGLAASLLAGLVPVVGGALLGEHQAWRAKAEEETTRRLVDDERLRMAREVHDVVGHSLSIISLQAGVALHVLDRRPEQAQISLEAIRRTAVEALDELRATLALTRAGQSVAGIADQRPPAGPELPAGPGSPTGPEPPAALESPATRGSQTTRGSQAGPGSPAAGRPPEEPTSTVTSTPTQRAATTRRPTAPPAERAAAPGAERAPLTGLGRLPSLLAEVRLCGIPIEAVTSGPLDTLPADVDLAAYRIVQESLTNVLRHAAASLVTVEVTVGEGEVSIDVADAPDRPVAPLDVFPGQGLTGLRERAAELGGHLWAGPCVNGGWRVRARLPVARAWATGSQRGGSAGALEGGRR